MGQGRWAHRRAWSLGALLVGAVLARAGQQEPPPAPPQISGIETKPVSIGRLELNRLKGDVVCVYNFSSW